MWGQKQIERMDMEINERQFLWLITRPLGNISQELSSFGMAALNKCIFWPKVKTDL